MTAEAPHRRPRLRHRQPALGREGPAARRGGGAPRDRRRAVAGGGRGRAPGRGRLRRVRRGAARERPRGAGAARPSRRGCRSSGSAWASSCSTRARRRARGPPASGVLPRHGRAAAAGGEAPADAVEPLDVRGGERAGAAAWARSATPGSTSCTRSPRPSAPRPSRCATTAGPVAALVEPGAPCGATQFHPEKSGCGGPRAPRQLRATSHRRRRRDGALPAIDLRAGAAVRLTQGDFAREQRYGDPVELAARYIAAGARWIHVVDLDAARTGVPHERAALAEIVRLAARSASRCRAGGGVRAEDDAAELLESRRGAGGARHRRPRGPRARPAAGAALARTGGRRASTTGSATDGRGRGAGAGVAGGLGPLGPRAARRCGRASRRRGGRRPPSRATACCRAPTSTGSRRCSSATALPVVASGGVRPPGDLTALARLPRPGARLAGAIVGKALVEGRFERRGGMAACAASG